MKNTKDIDGYIKFKHNEKRIYIDGDISMQELQAINMKCKEFGWSDE